MDSLPIVSQVKSAVQFSIGNWEGARATQENFSKQCVIVSQIRQLVERAHGNEEAANNTNEEFCKNTDGLLRKTPIVGHARGCLAYLLGDKERGDETMVEATKTTVGAAVVVFICHGGFLISSGCWVAAQRVREVDAPETMRSPRPEGCPSAQIKRVVTTNFALTKLDMLDDTMDDFIAPFSYAFWHVPMQIFAHKASSLDLEREDVDDDSEVQILQYITEAEDEEDQRVETAQKNQKTRGREYRLKPSEFDLRRRARSPSFEGRQRLHEWRYSMERPQL